MSTTGFNVDERHRAITAEEITIGGVKYTRRLRTVELDNALRDKAHDLNDAVDEENDLLSEDARDRKKLNAASEKVRMIQFETIAMLLVGPKGADADPKVVRGHVDTRVLPDLQRYLDRPAPDPS